MNLDRLVAGLDIGSAKTTAVIAEVVGDLPKHPTVNILGVGQARTTGLRRGVVADIDETTRSITKALQDAERDALDGQSRHLVAQPELAMQTMREVDDETAAVREAAEELLTPRQQRILQMSCEGWSVQETADELKLAPERVSDEKYKAVRKLCAHLCTEES